MYSTILWKHLSGIKCVLINYSINMTLKITLLFYIIKNRHYIVIKQLITGWKSRCFFGASVYSCLLFNNFLSNTSSFIITLSLIENHTCSTRHPFYSYKKFELIIKFDLDSIYDYKINTDNVLQYVHTVHHTTVL